MLDGRTRALGARIIAELNIPPRNEQALVRGVQLWAQNIKFFREFPEVNAAPWVTAAWGIGDCDDKARLIAALLKSFRIPVRLVFITFRKPGMPQPVSHVYPEAFCRASAGGMKWQALESVQRWPMGKDPMEMLRSKGRTFTFFRLDI